MCVWFDVWRSRFVCREPPKIPTGAYDSVAQKGVCKLNPADGGCIVGNQCGCFIGGTCYPPGAQHPTNQCYECNRAVSTSQWTARVVGYTCKALLLLLLRQRTYLHLTTGGVFFFFLTLQATMATREPKATRANAPWLAAAPV